MKTLSIAVSGLMMAGLVSLLQIDAVRALAALACHAAAEYLHPYDIDHQWPYYACFHDFDNAALLHWGQRMPLQDADGEPVDYTPELLIGGTFEGLLNGQETSFTYAAWAEVARACGCFAWYNPESNTIGYWVSPDAPPALPVLAQVFGKAIAEATGHPAVFPATESARRHWASLLAAKAAAQAEYVLSQAARNSPLAPGNPDSDTCRRAPTA